MYMMNADLTGQSNQEPAVNYRGQWNIMTESS